MSLARSHTYNGGMTNDRRGGDPLVDLANRIRSGDVAAFERLFRQCHGALCEVVDSYVSSQDTAEEIVQDLFFVIWIKRDRLPAARSFRAYLFAAARNRALHHLRHRSIIRRWAARADSHPDVAGTAAQAPNADEALEARERDEALQKAIALLPRRARLALVLHREHDMNQADVATAMGISVKGVEKLLATAKSKLRTLLMPARSQ
jgi:RNA polymerase sigma-70 factor (ECF subfamily)